MNSTASVFLDLLSKVVPLVSGQAGPMGAIIGGLIKAAPLLIEEGTEVISQSKKIVAVIKGDPATTAAQLAELAAIDAKFDAAFDEADAKAEAEDKAAGTA